MNAVAAALRTSPGETSASYYDTSLRTDAIKLLPADYAVSDRPLAMVTLLGSCVAACLYDPAVQLGGMNHFMLPDAGVNSALQGTSARFGAHAMELLINALLKRGAHRARLQAKVFGGGNVLSGFSDPIGTRNASFVLDYLRAEHIPVMAQDLGDIHPRKVAFFVRTGRTLVKRLPATRDRTLVDSERAYQAQLASRPSGTVELF